MAKKLHDEEMSVETPVETPVEASAEETPAPKKRRGKSTYLRCRVKKNGKCGGIILNKGTTVVVKRSLGERARSLNIVEVLGEEWQ